MREGQLAAMRERRTAFQAREQAPVEWHSHDHRAHPMPSDDDADRSARCVAARRPRSRPAEHKAYVGARKLAELSPIEMLERSLNPG